MKLKYITRLSLACGVMITAVAFSGCSGSAKAVQANAAVMSSSGVMSTEPNSEVSEVSSNSTLTSSDLVSHAAPSVSSAVAVSGGVSSQRPSSNNSNSTSHQAPTTSRPSNGGGSTSRPASTRPASTTPAPTPRPASQAPAPRPTSTAPATQSFGSSYGSRYGCSSKSDFDYVVSRASAIDGSSAYESAYSKNKDYASLWKSMYGVEYSDELNRVKSLIAGVPSATGSGNASYTSAYDYYKDGNGSCVGIAQARVAALQCAGYSAKIVRGRTSGGVNHAWVRVSVNGTQYDIDGKVAAGTLPGYSVDSVSYN